MKIEQKIHDNERSLEYVNLKENRANLISGSNGDMNEEWRKPNRKRLTKQQKCF